MVRLLVDDFEQITTLEIALLNANIEYTTELNDGKYGIASPYLIVNSIPLDMVRAMKWIGEIDV